jgi:serine/threonine-protein kinase RsbW
MAGHEAAVTPARPRVAVRCSATSAGLNRVHEAMARFWPRLRPQPPEEWKLLFELAVAEIAANIIEHSRPDVMGLRLTVTTCGVTAEFTDRGAWCEGGPRPAARVDDDAERGRGLSLARTAVDELHYERTGSLNCWRLVKCL